MAMWFFDDADLQSDARMFHHFQELTGDEVMSKGLNPYHWVSDEREHLAFEGARRRFLEAYEWRQGAGWSPGDWEAHWYWAKIGAV